LTTSHLRNIPITISPNWRSIGETLPGLYFKKLIQI